MLTIEFEPPTDSTNPCPCCGGRNIRLTRFVYRDGDAYAIYYALLSDSHPGSPVHVLVGIGEWAEDAPASERCAFHLRLSTTADEFQVSVCDAAESPWGEVELFGRALSRDEALAHPRIEETLASPENERQ